MMLALMKRSSKPVFAISRGHEKMCDLPPNLPGLVGCFSVTGCCFHLCTHPKNTAMRRMLVSAPWANVTKMSQISLSWQEVSNSWMDHSKKLFTNRTYFSTRNKEKSPWKLSGCPVDGKNCLEFGSLSLKGQHQQALYKKLPFPMTFFFKS